MDRQVFSMLAPLITADFRMNNAMYAQVVFAFQLSYTIMFSVGGYVLDRVGTKAGLALSIAVWSIASVAQGFVTGPLGLGAARFLLGVGEGGCFPAATKGATEWFPAGKRALAIGFANGGSALGAVLAPPLTAFAVIRLGWRGTFFALGAIGFAWLAVWLISFRVKPETGNQVCRTAVTFGALCRDRRLWCILIARFIFDPVFYFYMFWIPQYMVRSRHLSLHQIGSCLWIGFLVLGFSQVFGGYFAGRLARLGMTAIRSKSILMAAAALVTMVSWLVPLAPDLQWTITMISLLLFAHGIWITNFLGLLSDLFPSNAIATVTGLTGTAGGIGGMISSLVVGHVIDRFSFTPAFAVSGVLYPMAFAMIFLATRLTAHRNPLKAGTLAA
jgi:ACS family hexuronate transporter-like MFS transporter